MANRPTSSNRFDLSRRQAIKILGAGTIPILASADATLARAAGMGRGRPDPWREAQAILRRIRPPSFRNRYFDITHFGAVGDGVTDCTIAIRRAIRVCASTGGGHVVVPSGRFLTGAIHLESNVDLHLPNTDSVLAFSTDPKAYLPLVLTRWEGNDLYNYSPLIYAFQKQNIGITGRGTLDGQASLEHWWPWKGQTRWGWSEGQPSQSAGSARLRQQGGAAPRPDSGAFAQDPISARIYGEGWYLRPNFVEPYGCRNVLIDGITIVNSPFWLMHPVYCTNVTIRNYRAASLGTNNDGCDPESCTDVLIENCTFDTGDDCIAFKAGRGLDGLRNLLRRGRPAPCQNVVVQDCRFANGHGGFTIGSEMSGGVRNVFADGLAMTSPDLEIAVRFKTNSFRGGRVENIHVRNVQVPTGVSNRAISIDYFYEEGQGGPFLPEVTDVFISNMTVGANPNPASEDYAIYLRGYQGDPIGRVRISDSSFFARRGNLVEAVTDLELQNVWLNGSLLPPSG